MQCGSMHTDFLRERNKRMNMQMQMQHKLITTALVSNRAYKQWVHEYWNVSHIVARLLLQGRISHKARLFSRLSAQTTAHLEWKTGINVTQLTSSKIPRYSISILDEQPVGLAYS